MFPKTHYQGFTLVYTNDILLLAYTKTHMLDSIDQLHKIFSYNNVKTAPEKVFYILHTSKYVGHEIDNKATKPISPKVDGIQKLKTLTSRTETMRFIGSMNFYSKFITHFH